MAQIESTHAQTSFPNVDDANVGDVYFSEQFDDWSVLCVKLNSGKGPCHLYQLLRNHQGHAVSEISLFKLDSGKSPVSATIVTPLKTLLSSMLVFSIDNGSPRHYPFSLCDIHGCYGKIIFTPDELNRMLNGGSGNLLIESASDPGIPIVLPVSFLGLTAALNALE